MQKRKVQIYEEKLCYWKKIFSVYFLVSIDYQKNNKKHVYFVLQNFKYK